MRNKQLPQPTAEWSVIEQNKKGTRWEKVVTRKAYVTHEKTPDPLQACEQLLTSLIEHETPPGTPAAHQTILDTLRTGSRPLTSSQWVTEGHPLHLGGGPALLCFLERGDHKNWEKHYPDIRLLAFGETDFEQQNGEIAENQKLLSWYLLVDQP